MCSKGFENMRYKEWKYKKCFPLVIVWIALYFFGMPFFYGQRYTSSDEALGMINSYIVSVEYRSPNEELVIVSDGGGEKVKMRESQWEVFLERIVMNKEKGLWLIGEKVFVGRRFRGYTQVLSRIR